MRQSCRDSHRLGRHLSVHGIRRRSGPCAWLILSVQRHRHRSGRIEHSIDPLTPGGCGVQSITTARSA